MGWSLDLLCASRCLGSGRDGAGRSWWYKMCLWLWPKWSRHAKMLSERLWEDKGAPGSSSIALLCCHLLPISVLPEKHWLFLAFVQKASFGSVPLSYRSGNCFPFFPSLLHLAQSFWFVLLDSWVTSLSLTAPCITLYSFPICLLLCNDTDLHEMERCAAFHVRFCYALCNDKFPTEITLLLYPVLLFPRCVSMRTSTLANIAGRNANISFPVCSGSEPPVYDKGLVV